MAAAALSRVALPPQSELDAFARTAAHLLTERMPRAVGSRVVHRRAGMGIQPLDHREYVPGDEIRHIDWRQTARRQRPVTRRFEAESTGDWLMLLDASSSMRATTKWAHALCVVSAMSYALLELGHRVGVLAFGADVLSHCPAGRGQHQYATIARLLCTFEPRRAGETSNLAACAPYMRGASAFVASDFLATDAMERELALLHRRATALHAVQVTDESDTMVPDSGVLELVDAETGAHRQVAMSETVCMAATRARAAMTERLQAFCVRNAIAFTASDARQPWQPMLVRHLMRAQRAC